MDVQRINDYLKGISYNGYEIFGAHPSVEYDQLGVRFTVYAPHAARIQLIGECNDWNGFDMRRLDNGVWTIFIKDAAEGQMYKYRIFSQDGAVNDRADPFAFYSEVRPNTASIIYSLNGFSWTDSAWMSARDKNYNSSMSIYEVHAGSWKTKDSPDDDHFYNYSELADMLIPYVKEMGYTHIELLPLTEYPFDGSWGYQVTGYYAATSRYGTPKDLMDFVNRCHNAGIGVIMDFVPVHFVNDFYALHQFDGGFLYESDNESQRFSEWGTALFDFTKPHVISFLRSSLNFWLGIFHFDGIRYDAVSNLIYVHGKEECGINDPGLWFLRSTNYTLQQLHPNAMLIAEDSSNYLKVTAPVPYGGLGFDYKWNLGWMHDTLDYLAAPPAQRNGLRDKMMFTMNYFYNDIFILPFSHDEVVHGKGTIINRIYGNYEEKFAQLRVLYLYMFTHPGKKLNFMGNELAEFKEWDESKELGWNLEEYEAHQKFKTYFSALQRLYQTEKSFYEQDYNMQGFQWLNARSHAPAVFAYCRDDLAENQTYVILNFSNNSYQNYTFPVKEPGTYLEILHTDQEDFGGKGRRDSVVDTRYQGGGFMLSASIAPYSGVVFKKDSSGRI